MKQDILSTIRTPPAGRIQLAGTVAGIRDCELVADTDLLVIGSGIECDLAVPDPLFPRRAFVIRRTKCHAGPDQPCRCFWTLESPPESRVFVNNRLTHKEKLSFGDSISIGCHRFTFSRADDATRNRRANSNVGDLCARLMAARAVPAGFLAKSALYGYYVRRQKAMLIIAIFTAVLAVLTLLTPRREVFTPVQNAMDVVMIAETQTLPAPDAVRSLAQVARKSVTEPAPETTRPELQPLQAVPPETLLVQPAMQMTMNAPAPAAMRSMVADTPAPMPPLDLAAPQEALEIGRQPARLAMAAPLRRLTVAEAEAASLSAAGKLGRYETRMAQNPDVAVSIPAASLAAAGPAKPSTAALEEGRAQRLNQVAAYTPSPVQFETLAGETIPVARISEQLAELKVESAGPADIQIDGKVTEAEIAASWKSGQLRIHGPGKPPPLGNPPTFCYVTKKDLNGRPCLYVSFVCLDPQLDKLVVRGNREIPAQDSVEIYLDVKGNRSHYYQLMVNSHGDFEGHDHPNPRTHNPWRGVTPVIKTSINKEAGQWTCEVLLPFDQLGGVPAKGTRWSVNFVRNFRGQPENRGHSQPGSQVQTWFEVYDRQNTLHQPNLFGIFQW